MRSTHTHTHTLSLLTKSNSIENVHIVLGAGLFSENIAYFKVYTLGCKCVKNMPVTFSVTQNFYSDLHSLIP